MIFVDHYFRPNQTPENAEIIFQKSFYAETNGALDLNISTFFMFLLLLFVPYRQVMSILCLL